MKAAQSILVTQSILVNFSSIKRESFMSHKIAKTLLGILAASCLAVSTRAQSNTVYAVEFNQSNNRFGTIDLLNGNFTLIANLGGTLYNDIAYCPTNGVLYGVQNFTDLVTFDKTTGAVTTIGTLSVSGIESIAFRPSDGVLFGATGNGLYTIDTTTGQATFVGYYGEAYHLNLVQNMRFDRDGNLYVGNTSNYGSNPTLNTDIYRVSVQDGHVTFVGEVIGLSNLMLENGSQYMYGVSIPAIGNGVHPQPELVSFDLSSFVDFGTNDDGSIHEIAITLVGGGPNFPVNFNFSGNVPQPAPIYVPRPPKLAITPLLGGNGNVQIVASGGISGQTYVLEASTGQQQWTAISTNTADINGTFPFVDSDAKNHQIRFYRTVTPGQ
jgi:hypothetical protein